MSRNPADQLARKRKLLERIASPAEDHMPRCMVPDMMTGRFCGRPTARKAKQGLSGFYCRYHIQRKARHGSHWHLSYTAAELNPFLRAAIAVIVANRSSPFIVAALSGLQDLVANAPPAEPVTRLRGRLPRERALQALARMRERGVRPERLLAICLAVGAIIEADPMAHRVREFRIVQMAKAAHRLAAGTHKVWEVKDDTGRLVQRTEMHAYARSSGRVLRYLGAMLERECELVTEHFQDAVIDRTKGIEAAENAPQALAQLA